MKARGVLLFVLLCVVLIAGVATYVLRLWAVAQADAANGSNALEAHGLIGDSFGWLTSLFTALAFAGLIYTIIMQKQELAIQREEWEETHKEIVAQRLALTVQTRVLSIQQFEGTFFEMLRFFTRTREALIDDLYEDPRLTDLRTPSDTSAMHMFDVLILYFEQRLRERAPSFSDDVCVISAKYEAQYIEVYAEFGSLLDPYFRLMYNLLKLVDRTDAIEHEGKGVYTNLLRAMLSHAELQLLDWNCASQLGREKMTPLVNRYNLLKNLDTPRSSQC